MVTLPRRRSEAPRDEDDDGGERPGAGPPTKAEATPIDVRERVADIFMLTYAFWTRKIFPQQLAGFMTQRESGGV